MEDSKNKITSDTLPLEVREELMRGNAPQAVKILSDKYNILESESNELLQKYRENLKMRAAELEIKAIQEKFAKEANEGKNKTFSIVVKAVLVTLVLLLLFLIIKYVK